jgi:hypothetical protein
MSYAKAIGYSYSPRPSITAPVPDSTSAQSSVQDVAAVKVAYLANLIWSTTALRRSATLSGEPSRTEEC